MSDNFEVRVLGLTVEQISDLKNFFEMHTGMQAEEYGGSLIDILVRENSKLTQALDCAVVGFENIASDLAHDGYPLMPTPQDALQFQHIAKLTLAEIEKLRWK